MKYKVTPNSTITIKQPDPLSDYAKRLAEKYPTPNADKVLKDNPEMKEFDEHKFFN